MKKNDQLIRNSLKGISYRKKSVLLVLLFVLFLGTSLSFSQHPDGISGDNELLQLGYLDVTLLGADNTGKANSTEAFRTAVKLARDYDLVCYIPSGTYLVSDTIRVMRKALQTPEGTWRTDNHQCIIVGDPKERPLIKLMKDSPNFQDTENPMPVFWLYSMSAWGQQAPCEGDTDPLCGQANINFNQSIRSLDIDLQGNPGAIGIWHDGAQGATIEDVKINATGAYAGLYNPPGQAGGTYNVEIIGGQYGVYVGKIKNRHQSRHNLFMGCIFKNQEKAVFHFEIYTPVILVGFHIVKDQGPINTTLPEFDGFSLIDGVIELGGGKIINNENIRNIESNVYFRNVYVRGADEITNGSVIDHPKGWTCIDEYSYCDANSRNLINGELNSSEVKSLSAKGNISGDEMAYELINKHLWDELSYPHFKSYGIVNVKDPEQMNGNPAVGDGQTDDTKALEYAIANYGKIFLPKGQYLISNTLTLKANTHIFGIDRTLSSITTSRDWNGGENAPMIVTVDEADAKPALSFMSVRSRQNPLEWRAGRNSRLRSVSTREIHITGNGGGRWSGIFNVGSQFKIYGTHEPLLMYSTNPERAGDPQFEIRDSKNVQIYFLKSEAGVAGIHPSIPCRVINSENIAIFGGTGHISFAESPGSGMIEIENCEDIVVTHFRPWRQSEGWYTLKEEHGGEIYGVEAIYKLALYKRGEVDLEVE